jgi:DNA-binding CsgD family transcriptional regulator
MRHFDLDIEFAGFQSFELMLFLWGFGWLVLALFPKRFIFLLLKIAATISAVLLLFQILLTADMPSRLPGVQLSVFMAYMFFNGICCACAFFLFCFNLNNVERMAGIILLICYHGLDFAVFKTFPAVQKIYETWCGIAVMVFFLVLVFLFNKKTSEININENKNTNIAQDIKEAKVGIIIPLHIVYFTTMMMIHYLEPAENIIFSLPYGLGQFISIIFTVLVMVLLNRNPLYIWLSFLVFTLFGLSIVNYNSAAAQFSGSLVFGTGDGLGYIITIYLCAGEIKKSKSIKMYRLYCFILFIEYVFISGILSKVFNYFAESTHTVAFIIVLVLCSLCFLILPYLQKKLFSEDWTDGLSVADIPEYIPALEQAEKADKEDNLGLTPREKDVFALLMQNMPLKTIALELGITFNTVNSHYRSIYRKLGITSKGELFLKYKIKT